MGRLLPAFVLSLTAVIACGDGEDVVSRPDPLPISGRDTATVFVSGTTYVTSRGDTVEISDFRLGRYEITNGLYYNIAVRENIPLPPDPLFPGMDDYLYRYPDYPAVNVSMTEALLAARSLGGRLPTRAEWEYAASLDLTGEVEGQYPWGILDPADAEYPANYLAGDEWETRGLDGYLWTAPVDSFPLTNAGFACQAGNVAEWAFSPMDSLVYVCGGAWLSPADQITVDAFRRLAPGDRARHVGFRVLIPLD
jgi:formylglycine-generating enzyme required for sulfatase activity